MLIANCSIIIIKFSGLVIMACNEILKNFECVSVVINKTLEFYTQGFHPFPQSFPRPAITRIANIISVYFQELQFA